MILLTCPRCHKADDDCQCWPLAKKPSIRKQVEARFGMTFDQVMQDLADRGLNRRQAAEELQVSYPALRKLLDRGVDPFPSQDAALRYLRENGESLVSAAYKLSRTHTLHQAAALLGVAGASLKKAFEARGLTVTFKQRYGGGRKRKRSERFRSYEVNGVKGSLRELTERFASVPLSTVRHRVHDSHWPVEKAILTPYVEIENRDKNLAKRREGYARAMQARQNSKR